MCKTEDQANIVKKYLEDYENMLWSRKIVSIEAISICNSCDYHYNNQNNKRNYYQNRHRNRLRQVPNI